MIYEVKYELNDEVFYARTKHWALWMHTRKAQGIDVVVLSIRETR